MSWIKLQNYAKKASSSAQLTLKAPSGQEEIPIPGYQFSVELDGQTMALFQSVSGLSVQREVHKAREGGINNFAYEFPGTLSYGHLTLERGLSSSNFFWKWMIAGQYVGDVQKKDIFLVQRCPNPGFVETKRWSFHQAFPVSWKISSLSVDNVQKIALETLELSFQYFQLA